MRDNLRSQKLVGRDSNNMVCHRLAAAQDVGGDRSGGDRAIFVIYLADVSDVRDVSYVVDVSDVGDIDHAEIFAAVVIPRKIRLSRTQREPCRQFYGPDC
jgi:hypothetical protein